MNVKKKQVYEIYGRKVNFIVQKCKCIGFPLAGGGLNTCCLWVEIEIKVT